MYCKGPHGGNVFNSELCFRSLMRSFAQSGHILTAELASTDMLGQ